MGPDNHALPHDHAPHPEQAALAFLDAYSRHFGLSITASHGDWTVEGGGLEKPVKIGSYTELTVFLARNFGWPVAHDWHTPAADPS